MSALQSHPGRDGVDRSPASIPVPRPDHQVPAIAVVKIGRTGTDIEPVVQDAAAESLRDAAMIHDPTRLIAEQRTVVARTPEDVTARLSTLPDNVVCVIVVGTDPAHYDLISRWARVNRQCDVVTDQDVTAVAAAAELLTTLTQHGLSPRQSRAVIAGAATPLLSRLLGCRRLSLAPDHPTHRCRY
jgi:hypothetical protein